MRRTIIQHVEVCDEAEYAAAIKYMAHSPWVTDFGWTWGTQSLNDLLEALPDPVEGSWLPTGTPASVAAFTRRRWPR
jgi:hypothetical protein